MNPAPIVVQGVVKPDGTLELERKLPLPAGKVQVTVEPLPTASVAHPFWQMMEEIWAGQRERGHVPRSVEEVEAERGQLREEWEDRLSDFARIQDECRRAREEG